MPQAALSNYAQQENPCKVIPFPKQKFYFAQMESTETTFVFDKMAEQTESKIKKGMDYFPIEVYNQMIDYSLNNGKFRNAMLMVCMANWGMRYSDVVRVRFGYLFDNNGQFKDSFSLPNGEKKTSKTVVYYNNEATKSIISLYLQQPENAKKSRLDFLFVSESQTGNKPTASVQQLEAEDLYNYQIKDTKEKIENLSKKIVSLMEDHILKKKNDYEYNNLAREYNRDKLALEQHLSELEENKKNYVSLTPNAEKIYIQKPLSHTAGEDIIKNTLKRIGINPKNRKNKSENQTTNDKYNTHSLRKTFSYWFIEIGEELKNREDLSFDATILDLLKEKLKHSSLSVTAHYTDAQQRAFKTICQHLNIGLEVVENYMYGG